MSRADILAAIQEILSEILIDYDSSGTAEDTPVSEVSPNVDSMTINELILGIEDRFEIEVPEGSFKAGAKISDVIDFIEGQV